MRFIYLFWWFTSERIYNAKFLPQCVGFVDGTLIPLMEQPLHADHADFFGRKKVICF
jgi:hypothetical protein